MAFTIENHELLGIQAIHDYVGCRSGGRAVAARDRRGSSRSRATGWARRGRRGCISRSTRIPRSTSARSPTYWPRRSGECEPVVVPGSTAALPLPPLRAGAAGPRVVQLQEILAFWGYYQSKIDGQYGHAPLPRCRNGRRRWRHSTSAADGVYGPVPTLPRPRRTPLGQDASGLRGDHQAQRPWR